MSRRKFHGSSWVCLAPLVLSCGGGERPPTIKPQPTVAAPVEPAPSAFVSPARWAFHPPNPTAATASVMLPNGSCLFTTDEGIRATTTKGERSSTGLVTCRGRMTAASDVLFESLVGMVERGGSSWLFVGDSGALYEADGPLEPFRRVLGAPTNFTKVTGNGKTVLAVAPLGELFRLDDTFSWQAVNVPGARFYDLAIADDGSALALALPEKLYTSSDGRAFSSVSAPATIGARYVGRTAKGTLAAQGVMGTIAWDPKQSTGLARTNDSVVSRGAALDLDATTIPTATAVVEGRAVLDGDRYVEAVLVDEESGAWGLATGTFDGPLTTTRLPDTNECAWMRVGARGRHITTVCVRTDDDGNHVARVRMSSDGGGRFVDAGQFTSGDGEPLDVAVANDGHALITGMCKARVGVSGCSGSPPMILQIENGTIATTLAAAPPLMGSPISPAFSSDGRSAYFLSRRAKDEKLALFVSHDGGRTFTERTLDARRHSSASETDEPVDDESPRSSEESFDPSDLTTIHPSEDGTIGMVLTTSRGLSYLTTDEDGRVLGMSQPPVEQAIMGGFGRRVLAIATASSNDRASGNEPTTTAWESNDGGMNWNEISVTRSVVREIYTGPMTAACSSAGCMVGMTITRVGWDGQTDAPSLAKPKGPDFEKVKAIRTPLVCTLDPKTQWKRIDHVWTGPPTLSAVARGRTLWSVLSFDPNASALSTTTATYPERGEGPARVATRSLFAPAPKGVQFAADVSTQIEGYAATRIRVPEGDDPTGPMRNIEVAWENYFDGTSKQTTLPDAGVFGAGDVKRNDERRYLDTGLMSVTGSAIFVQPHARGSSDKRMFLLETNGKRSTFEFPDWKPLQAFGQTNLHSDAALAEGKPMAVGTVEKFEGDSSGPLTMLLAPPLENGVFRASATSLFLPTSSDHQRILSHDWTYRGATEVGTIGISSEPRAGRATAAFFPFRADGSFGPAVELPTPFDLPEQPRPCKAEERRTTPRVGAYAITNTDLMFPGYRHPIFVTEATKDKPTLDDTLVLMTWGTVLHGTKESPCVAAWEAFGIAPIGIVAVIGGDPSQAWLFRRVQDAPASPGLHIEGFGSRDELMLEHRPMSCRFDSSANIPEVVWAQPGTFRWKAK